LDLLSIILKIYKKNIEIVTEYNIKMNHSLIPEIFHIEKRYIPSGWNKMILELKNINLKI